MRFLVGSRKTYYVKLDAHFRYVQFNRLLLKKIAVCVFMAPALRLERRFMGLEPIVLPLNDTGVCVVGETGLEPARPSGQRFLRPLRATYFATLP